jgi:hypothetical protein
MWRIWRRKCTSFWRNIFLMFFYLYMVISVILGFVIVGSFYGLLSFFLKGSFPTTEDNCYDSRNPAFVLQNVYLWFLFLILIMATTIEVTWAESSYRAASIFMGIISVLMIGSAVVYAANSSNKSISVVFFGIFLLSYIVPLWVNYSKMKIYDFIKGVIYATYLSPTYVNILAIYAISNIHDITWGSRPEIDSDVITETEKKKEIIYKNYRSKFMIFWAAWNLSVGVLISSSEYFIIVIIGGFLGLVMLFKVVLSLLHNCKQKCDRIIVSRHMNKLESNVFSKEAMAHHSTKKEDDFSVYFDEDDNANLYIAIGG